MHLIRNARFSSDVRFCTLNRNISVLRIGKEAAVVALNMRDRNYIVHTLLYCSLHSMIFGRVSIFLFAPCVRFSIQVAKKSILLLLATVVASY